MTDEAQPPEAGGLGNRSTATSSGRGGSTAKLTVVLPAALVEELRNTVVALSGPPHRLTLTGVVRQALGAELERLRDERGGRAKGRVFPPRQESLRAGRPIG